MLSPFFSCKITNQFHCALLVNFSPPVSLSSDNIKPNGSAPQLYLQQGWEGKLAPRTNLPVIAGTLGLSRPGHLLLSRSLAPQYKHVQLRTSSPPSRNEQLKGQTYLSYTALLVAAGLAICFSRAPKKHTPTHFHH